VEERGFATAIFHSGVFVSVVIANPLVAWLVIHSGWRWSFVIVGALGFVWLYFGCGGSSPLNSVPGCRRVNAGRS
jgi:MFS family permease